MAWYSNYGFRSYVPVSQRRRRAQRELTKLQKKGKIIRPVQIDGRAIARSFWGKAWCDNLESYSDFENRLPRGRTYVRNGSVVHLDIQKGQVEALVSGSELYRVKVKIAPVPKGKWQALCRECAGGIGSLVELLQGRLSNSAMTIITRRETGLFPSPGEIKLDCSCPDWAGLCKHLAAVLYGVGARLDQSPELLFLLRSVNHEELIVQAASAKDLAAKASSAGPELSEAEIGDVFGIELDTQTTPRKTPSIPLSKPKSRTKPKRPRQTKRPARATLRGRGRSRGFAKAKAKTHPSRRRQVVSGKILT